MIGRVTGRAAAEETPIGLVPTEGALDCRTAPGSGRPSGAAAAVDRGEWAAEVPEIRAFFHRSAISSPPSLAERLAHAEQDLARVAV
jgi:phosphoenolpyruvate carboxykinase (GTP)